MGFLDWWLYNGVYGAEDGLGSRWNFSIALDLLLFVLLGSLFQWTLKNSNKDIRTEKACVFVPAISLKLQRITQ